MERPNQDGRESSIAGNRKKLNFAARTMAAASLLVAGGIGTVEKTTSFDPLANSVGTAKHLVLDNPHKSYEQLIDSLPEVEKAEAAPPAPEVTYPSPGSVSNSSCATEQIDFIPHSQTMYVGQSTYETFTVDACLNPDTGLEVRLVEEDKDTDDTLGKISVQSLNQSMRITFYLDCVDGGMLPNKIVGSSGYSQDAGGTAQLAIETDYAGTFPPEIVNSVDNIGAKTGAAQWSCLDAPTPTPCPSGSGSGAGSEASGVCPVGVGGIAELPESSQLPQNMDSKESEDNKAPIAGGIAVVAAALTAVGIAAYKRNSRIPE